MKHIFIVNPYAGKRTDSIHIRDFLAGQEGLDYYVFNTRYAGYEKELMKKIYKFFGDEKLRIYCCGGSGTMRNILSGLDRHKLDNIEIAMYPCGLSNDFLKVFGKERSRFHDLNELIHGEVLRVDYIVTNHGVALNTISTGVDSAMQYYFKKMRGASVFGKDLPYVLSAICGVILSPKIEYDIWTDNMHKKGCFSEICYGNGNVLGENLLFALQTDPADGKGFITLIPRQNVVKNINVLNSLKKTNQKKLENILDRKDCHHIRICRSDGNPFAINFDGELVDGIRSLEARIVKRGLKFVVPQGVRPECLQEQEDVNGKIQ